MTTPLRKATTLNLSHQKDRLAFVQKTHNAVELLHKEIDVNRAEQDLLHERIRTAKELINNLPSHHPNYSQLVTQKNMDLIELDELKIREELITETLRTRA